ncbi:MAG TPA: NAD(P)/FAD-dependent oxidoreductase [Pyrinomonadaceae bacterium]
MSSNYDIIIIGAGHNGLITAAYLAQAGLKPLVLERRNIVGGAAVTEEIHPGFRCPTLAHSVGPLLPHIITDLNLKRHGLQLLDSDVRLLALGANGDSLCLYRDQSRTIDELKRVSLADAKRYPEFEKSFARIGRVLKPLLSLTPPPLDKPAFGEVFNLGKLGLAFRGLGKKDEYRLLRWGPMAVADLVAEWFENELLRAAVAARGVFGEFAGPWSAGTSAGLLFQAAASEHPIALATFVKGGMGALSESLAKAGTSAGAVIRTGVEVRQIRVKNGRAVGVQLGTGEEIDARAVASNADPKSTLLNLLDPVELTPSFLNKMRNYRASGVSAKVNLALSGLPKISALNGDGDAKLRGRIHIGTDIDYLERAFDAAKYGEFSPQPYFDITIPSLNDNSLAPAGAHVMSVYVQYAPYKLARGDWDSRREELGDTVVSSLSDYIPNLSELILARQVITPLDLERDYGLSGGHIHHGEQSLDQFFMFRPLIGWAQYRTPVDKLYLCGSGTHPGGGITGGPGANARREIIKDLKRR